jgi:hypothetical protein
MEAEVCKVISAVSVPAENKHQCYRKNKGKFIPVL